MEYVSAAFGVAAGALVAMSLLAAVALVVLATMWRIAEWVRVEAASRIDAGLTPDLVGYLRGGGEAALLASIARLHASNAIGQPGLVATGPYAGGTRLDSAVYAEISAKPGRGFGDLARSASVVAAVEAVRDTLKAGGYLGRRSGRWLRRWGRLVSVLIGMSGLAVGLFSVYGRSSGGELTAFLLVGSAVASFVLLGVLIRDRRLSARGEGAVRHLARRAPEWPYAVAIHGGPAIWSVDPAFAAAAGIPGQV
ncbi:hypothetical protein [Fodinicola acaciae]|uniref:hypothetical protein n=1 Tax=Fodinicola acaciae TaxID=2681555 RepID=UPI0013D0E880|nr:hypothetical protein [Fodinicola acaciae]